MMLVRYDVIQAGYVQHGITSGNGEDIIAQLHDIATSDEASDIICTDPMIVIAKSGNRTIPGMQSSQRSGQFISNFIEDIGDKISGYGHQIRILSIDQIHNPFQALRCDPLAKMDIGDLD